MTLAAVSNTAARQQYYQKIDQKNLTPLWEVLHGLVPPAPQPTILPALWKYADLRDDLLESGSLITAKEAERRVLILENPGARGQSCITNSLYAGLQLILPGEVAPAHRHSQSALRLVLEGEGAYTAVDGERTTMRRGDFIITPSNTWHDHGNPGDQPVVWLDGLDIPLVRFFDAGFAEKSSVDSQQEARPEGDALARYGRNMVPIDFVQRASEPTKVFVYPYTQTREALLGIARQPADPHLGHALRYVNPATGASPMPTIGAYARYLPQGFETLAYRSSDSAIFTCLEGRGTVEIGGQSFDFDANDVFVIPSWQPYRLHAKRAAIVFQYSDRPVQQALGLWREQKM
jgi:gentisate 1,2-dioxygenase